MSNLQTVDIISVLHQESAALQLFFMIYTGLMIGIGIWIVKNKQRIFDTEEFRFYVYAFYFLIGFLGGYCLLYTGGGWTLCRGINTGLLMAVLFLCSVKRKPDIKVVPNPMIGFVLTVCLCGVVSIWNYHCETIEERFQAAQGFTETVDNEKSILENVIILDENGERWENTVAHYGDVDNMYLSVPSGAGLNYMVDGQPASDAKYALYRKCGWESIYMETLVGNGYEIIYDDDIFTVLLNQQYK
jgi:hypothetical protein